MTTLKTEPTLHNLNDIEAVSPELANLVAEAFEDVRAVSPEVALRISEFTKRYIEHVPSERQDTGLVILKVHLVAEEVLRRFISDVIPQANHLPRLNFAGALALARSLCDEKRSDSWVWEALQKLNNIRNSYGHELVPSKIEDKLQDLVRHVQKHDVRFDLNDELTDALIRLSSSLFSLCSTQAWVYQQEGIKVRSRKG